MVGTCDEDVNSEECQNKCWKGRLMERGQEGGREQDGWALSRRV